MKSLCITLLAVLPFSAVFAQDADKVKELEQKVHRLEVRIARLESNAARAETTPEAKKMMKVARQHVNSERGNFKSEDIAKAEELYQKAAPLLPGDERNKLLDSVVSGYPQLNRAGCAQLYRAQQETGSEKERLLKDCLDRFSNCYYLDGAQVGPLAMHQLAVYYQQTGRKQEADKFFKRIRKESPGAVNHRGALLVDEIE